MNSATCKQCGSIGSAYARGECCPRCGARKADRRRSVGDLCWIYNAASSPSVARTEREHHRSAQIARSALRRLRAYHVGEWHETEDGRALPWTK
jgi:hypothetical protein